MSTTIPRDRSSDEDDRTGPSDKGHRPAPSDKGVWERLVTAWVKSKPYVLTGVAVGMLLVIIAKNIESLPAAGRSGALIGLVASLLEHLGMGFIVAAIAVLFYEWGAHIKDAVAITSGAVEVTKELKKNTEGVSASVENLSEQIAVVKQITVNASANTAGAVEVTNQLKTNLEGVSASVETLREQTATVHQITANVEGILKRLDPLTSPVIEHALVATISLAIQGEDNKSIVNDLVKYVLSVKDLDEHGDWASEGYVRYLGALLHNATHNADPLSKLSKQLHSNDGAAGQYRVDLLSPTQLTDIMLAEQMQRLPPLGKYSVVSNVGTWKGEKLAKLENASQKAVEKGSVLIRRIFVAADGAADRYPATSAEMEEVLTHHMELSARWRSETGGYQVKLLDRAAMREIKQRFPNAAAFIYEHHFGVFERPGQRHCVHVEVTSPDLADLRIAGLAPDSRELGYFEAVWGALPPLTESLLKDALARWNERHPI